MELKIINGRNEKIPAYLINSYITIIPVTSF